ncbi:hypothetical protein B9Z55_028839 [Caenorhabditis nigoni]|uniref:Uncharacterized protein n=1 Tax=Caenorhabditis nigoni TaxID=1611254 RepID=A0A2G5SA68_9PELO|nr:hypothetical protein B9Z55_028839 [Caenorhabditis nigoni]
MPTSNAKTSDTQALTNGSPAKNHFPRTRHVSNGKMFTYRDGQLLSIKKATKPTPFKSTKKKNEAAPNKKASASRNLLKELEKSKNQQE